MYSDDQLIQLSGIQHISFCKRQFMLIHAEHCWTENILTAQGRVLHDNAHDPYFSEKRKNLLITRAMPIVSYSLGLIGEADVVEFRAADGEREGVEVKGKEGKWVLMPIEYKRGKPKTEEHDRVQLCAQAICLEEMLDIRISDAELFYWEVRSRQKVKLDIALREHTKYLAQEMHYVLDNANTVRWDSDYKKCKMCSLRSECLPIINRAPKVRKYMDDVFGAV